MLKALKNTITFDDGYHSYNIVTNLINFQYKLGNRPLLAKSLKIANKSIMNHQNLMVFLSYMLTINFKAFIE